MPHTPTPPPAEVASSAAASPPTPAEDILVSAGTQDAVPQVESSSSGMRRPDSAEPAAGENGSRGSEGSITSQASSAINRRYVLTVVQQPIGSAEFGSNVLSRLPLSPPLIVQLQCFAPDDTIIDIDSNLPFLFSHLTLLPSSEPPAMHNPGAPLDVVIDSSAANSQPMRMLYGTLVSSPHELVLATPSSKEPTRGIFFVFPDVSVRLSGTYRLGIGLMRIAAPPGDPVNPPTHETLAFIATDNFEIMPLSDYIAPGPTPLTGSLADQGVQMFLGRHR